MALNPNENPCHGVNAHLNSELQTPGSRQAGRSSWPSFHADPIITIPLAGIDTLPFDFGTIYQHTFTVGRGGESLNCRRASIRIIGQTARIEAVTARVQAARESAN